MSLEYILESCHRRSLKSIRKRQQLIVCMSVTGGRMEYGRATVRIAVWLPSI